MKFDGIKKVSEGRFINRYDLYYTTEDDKKKVYEIISRNKDIERTASPVLFQRRPGHYRELCLRR